MSDEQPVCSHCGKEYREHAEHKEQCLYSYNGKRYYSIECATAALKPKGKK